MKAFLDTSVLVSAFLADHVHHEASLDLFTRFDRADAACGAHSLAETYSVLTRMPRYRIGGDQAMLFIGDIRDRLIIIALDNDDYLSTLQRCATDGTTGGAVYDALLAACALKCDATAIYSWNIRHYERLGANIAQRVRTP